MHCILQLGERLFIDLENGRCGNTRHLASVGTGVKLTHGQLRILSYLVENREHVCGIGSLQGLFDSSLGEEQVAGIKQQIQRIKNKLHSVDDTFERRRAKEVFQSVPGVGYRFHLPEGGEILEMAAPSDVLHRLDARWMKSIRQLGEEEKAAVRMRFDRMDSSWDNTLRASALGMVVHGADMRRQLRAFSDFVFLEYGSSGVVTMTSVGAEGKTVLLAEFAGMCIEEHPNWNVYEVDLSRMEPSREAAREIMEYIRQEGIGKIHRSVLLLDSADLLSDQFAYFLEQVLVTDQPWLYVVIADRLLSFTLAFEQPWLREYKEYMRVYMINPWYREMSPEEKAAWKAKKEALMESRTFYIKGADGKKREIDKKELEQAARRREEKIARRQLVTAPSIEMKKEVMAGIVKRCFAPWKHVQEELMKYLEDVPYERRSYVDLYLMLLGKAGREEESGRREIMELCACRGNAVWDDWALAVGLLDQKCEGEWILSEMFPIMAAMWIFGIRVTVEFLCRVTGKENFGPLGWILNEGNGNTIYVEDGSLLAPDMDMLYAFFYLYPMNTPEECLRGLFGYPWMDAEMLVEATQKTFVHFMHNRSESIPFSVDMLQLAGLAKQNHAYSRFYAEKELADVPELGVLWYSHLPDISRGKLSGTTIAFTTAFERVVDKEPHRRVRIQYWLRFLEVAVYYFEDVPDFLMNFYLESGEEMRENMLAGVKNNLHNGQYFLEKMWKERMEHYLLELRKAETADDEFANADGNEISDGIASGILNEDAENKIVNANEIIKGSAGENARENTRENSKENTKEDTETRTTWSRFRRCCRCSPRLYNRQGRNKEEEGIYREMETRIPTAQIRREIQEQKD